MKFQYKEKETKNIIEKGQERGNITNSTIFCIKIKIGSTGKRKKKRKFSGLKFRSWNACIPKQSCREREQSILSVKSASAVNGSMRSNILTSLPIQSATPFEPAFTGRDSSRKRS